MHGGVGFTPYRDSMAAWLEGSHAETREVYAASEGFIAIADRGPGEGLRLVLDRGLFFEFVRPGELDDAATRTGAGWRPPNWAWNTRWCCPAMPGCGPT